MKRQANRLLSFALAAALLATAGCGAAPEELPTYPVQLRLGGALPPDGQVGDYQVTLTEAYVVLGDWWIYGMDREAAGFAMLLKHAGHAHGEADFEACAEGTFVVDLLSEPQVVATVDLTEGHYFDGSLRLRPATDTYAPVLLKTAVPLTPEDPLWGHSLLLAGTATRGEQTFDFQITVDAEAMIAGLVYGATVCEDGAQQITNRLDLGALLSDLDFAALADDDDQVDLDCADDSGAYLLIKARLQDPTLYLHDEAEEVPQ